MSQTVTVTIPEALYHPLRRMAQATNQSLDAVLLQGLAASLPPLTDLSPETQQALDALEAMTTAELKQVLTESVPAEMQHRLEGLLERGQAGRLAPEEHEQLETLQHAADLVMLRKARAAVLLRFRGQRLPTLAELRQMTKPA